MFVSFALMLSSLYGLSAWKVGNTVQQPVQVAPSNQNSYILLGDEYIFDAPTDLNIFQFAAFLTEGDRSSSLFNLQGNYRYNSSTDSADFVYTLNTHYNNDYNYMVNMSLLFYDDQTDDLLFESSFTWSLYSSSDIVHTDSYHTDYVTDFRVEVSFKFYFLDESIFNTILDQYHTGYLVGYDDGYGVGATDTWIEAYQAGETNGYLHGYSDGMSQVTGSYNLVNLFGAIADTPIVMLHGMFNFEIFGVNVLTLILSLLTSLMLLFVVKKIWK